MFYYVENDDKIEKYKIIFNKEDVEILKKKIINDCNLIENKKSNNKKNIKKQKYNPVREKDYIEETKEYDEYNSPHLVELINKLLEHDTNVIDEIFKNDISNKLSIDEKINLVNKEFTKIDDKKKTEKKLKLQELEKLLKLKKLNQRIRNIDLYYEQLIGMIKFELVDTLPISEINKIESFLEIDLINKVTTNNSENKNFVKTKKGII